MRKILAVLLCLTMLLSLTVPAFAEETTAPGVQTSADTTPTTPVPPATNPAPVVTEPNPTTPPAPTTPEVTTPPAPTQCTHSWDAGSGTDATCTEAGTKTFTCTLCGGTKTETTPARGHSYSAWSATVDAHSRTCSVCGTADSGAHVFTESVTEAPTCKSEGVIADYCATCEYIVYEVLPKLTTHTYDNACDADCNVCGEVREVKHDHQAWWTKGASGHWHACSKCGDKGDFGKHFAGPAATEEEAQLCLTCGYTLTPKLNHQHEYATIWTADEEGHWYACSGCEEQKDFKGHDYDDPCDPDCNTCGYQNGNAHTFDGSWHSDEDGHWFVCSTCGGVVEAKDHVAPENAAAGEALYCQDCGYLMAASDGHTHVFSGEWKHDEGTHWQECACGETSEPSSHGWNEGTEQENGDTLYSCTVCGAKYTQEAPEEETGSDFPWGIVLFVLVIALAAAVVALIFVLKPKKKGRFSD